MSPSSSEAALATPLPRGAQIGRYLVLDPLGDPGGPEAYSAYDPRLGRKVALRILRHHAPPTDDPDARAASAPAHVLARLSHPHLLTVHDVGVERGLGWIATELVEGQTLGAWLAEAPRGWRALRDVFLAAGAGLAAAHRAGLVHGAFGEESVLIGRAGEVRVVDLGLGRRAAQAPVPGAQDGSAPGALDDQYSFAAALDRALATAAAAGRPRGSDRAPVWLGAALSRALRPDPAARFPTMDALLAALSADPAARLKRTGLRACAALAIAAAAALAVDVQRRRGDVCAPPEEELAGVWDAQVRARAAAAFERTAVPWAPHASRVTLDALDRFATRWATQSRQACEATRLRGEQSEELWARKQRCLEEARLNAGALARRLAEADVEAVTRAPGAVVVLDEVLRCDDAGWMRVQPPAPVEAVRAELAEVSALSALGRPQEARARLEPLRASLRGDPPLPRRAAVELAAGAIAEPEAAWPTLLEAAALAEAAGDDLAAARAYLALLRRAPARGLEAPAARILAEVARAALARLPPAPDLEVLRLAELARLEDAERRMAEALDASEAAARLAAHPGIAPDVRIALWLELARRLHAAAQHERGAHALEEAIRAADESFGREHPEWRAAVEAISPLYLALARALPGEERLTRCRRAVELASAAAPAEQDLAAQACARSLP